MKVPSMFHPIFSVSRNKAGLTAIDIANDEDGNVKIEILNLLKNSDSSRHALSSRTAVSTERSASLDTESACAQKNV